MALPLLLSTTANADPRQHTSQVIGTGSDTTEQILAAFTGETNGNYFTPLASDEASGRIQISSWNATPPPGDDGNSITCLVPKVGGNSFQRPNGSSQGRLALSKTIPGEGTLTFNNPAGDPACAGKTTAGLVHFARSSSGPSTTNTANESPTGTELTYVPFGKDAMSYAFYPVGGAATLPYMTIAELKNVLTAPAPTTGTLGGFIVDPDDPDVSDGDEVRVITCDIQAGSGTQKDWPKLVSASGGTGVTDVTIDTAAAPCEAINTGSDLDPSGDIQEHKSNQLKDKGDGWASAHPGEKAVLIVGMSASGLIAQANGAALNNLAVGVDLGSTIGSAASPTKPYNGTITNYDPVYPATSNGLTANTVFYSTTYGRLVYNVLRSSLVDGSGEFGIKQLFTGTSFVTVSVGGVNRKHSVDDGTGRANSKVCKAGTTIELFGYLQLPNDAASATGAALTNSECGSTTRRGGKFINA